MRDLASILSPSRTALVVVDMQNDYCHEQGACNAGAHRLSFFSTDLVAEMVPRLLRTIELARSVGTPVVWVRSEYSQWTTSPNWILRGAGEPLPICAPGAWGAELYDGFVPREDELMVVKHRYSPFVHTPFEQILRIHGYEALLLTGVTTNVCVETTARDAFMRDFNVVALSDCAAAYSKAVHEASMWNIKTHFGMVIDSTELERLWRQRDGGSDAGHATSGLDGTGEDDEPSLHDERTA